MAWSEAWAAASAAVGPPSLRRVVYVHACWLGHSEGLSPQPPHLPHSSSGVDTGDCVLLPRVPLSSPGKVPGQKSGGGAASHAWGRAGAGYHFNLPCLRGPAIHRAPLSQQGNASGECRSQQAPYCGIGVCVCGGGGDSHLFSEPPRPGLMHCSAPDLQWPGLSSLPPVPALTDPGPTSVKSRQSQLQPPVLLLCPHWATSPKAGLACAQEGSLQGSLVLMGSKQSPSAEQARRPL